MSTDAASEDRRSSHDLIVLGAGSGGYACALRAAELGLSVALVEQDKVGGTCLHRGCIPTKAWLHAAEVADTVREADRFGIGAELGAVDAAAIGRYADQVVSRLYKGLAGLIGSRRIENVLGHGVLEAGPETTPVVRVGDRVLQAPSIVLATGSAPRSLPIVPTDSPSVVDSDGLLAATDLPESLIVLGGGVIGTEFASAYASLGVKVTIVEALDRLLAAEEPESSAILERAFRRRRIEVLTGRGVESVGADSDRVEVLIAGGRKVVADRLLVAVGRRPVTEDLGFAEVGIGLDSGFVSTDERLRTTVDGVWAVGDIVRGPQLAHRGFAHGIFVAEEIAHRRGLLPEAPQVVVDASIPRVTYASPEVASVGLGEAAARAAGEVETFTYDLAGNGKSQILRTSGQVKLVRRKDGPVVGIHLVGDRVGELIGEAQLITGWEACPEDVAPLIHAHPTQGEALGEAHLALAGKPLHVHG
ncbi:dihydrolipoyl dehydrogenase [Naumannella halotolerans]|uniref:dihydrolipoyl dehydrogenase n=1 Tax=Naumannella halotolerans TaxID=993414 RepID=UPI00370D8A2E